MEKELARAEGEDAIAFFCAQSLDLAEPAARQRVLAWLEQCVGRIDAARDV